MKCAFLLLAVLGLAASASVNVQPIESRTIRDDWIEFVALIPRREIIHILVNHLATDVEFQNVIWFLVSDTFEAQVVELDAEQDFLNFLDYLESQDIHIYNFLNTIHDFLGIPLLPPPISPRAVDAGSIKLQKVESLLKHFLKSMAGSLNAKSTKTLESFWDELSAVWPSEEVRAFHQDKLENSPEYRAYFDSLSAQECRDLLNKVVVLPSWLAIVQDAKDVGINTDAFAQWIRDVLGWTVQP